MLTKEQLTDAHEQGLSISTRNGNIKIVAILNNVYGVNHFNSNKVNWWLFEQFEKQEAKIEQSKPEIDLSILKEVGIYYAKSTMHNYLFKIRYLTPKEIIWDSNILLRDSEIYNGIRGIKLSYVTELRLPTESELELFYSKFPNLKPKKYNGRAVKCDTVEQFVWLLNKLESKHLKYGKENFESKFNCIDLSIGTLYTTCESFDYYEKRNYEIISFSDYCKENGITEPKWIQGFEVKDGYNDVVRVCDDQLSWELGRLIKVEKDSFPFVLDSDCSWKYCRYPKRNEINEIKFSN